MDFKIVLLILIYSVRDASGTKRSFGIDYENDCFLKDGRPFRYVSSALHYFRIPRFYWKDRMMKLKSLGLNAIQTYIQWSLHEPEPGHYDFSGQNDVIEYIKLAQKMGFLVILRPGPYIDAERDLGGLPYWLLKNKEIKLRSSDPLYWNQVQKWFEVLLPKLKPLLYRNGGPIIMVQVENEYGSYFAHDHNYTSNLRDLLKKHFGKETVLFTVDIGDYEHLMYGTVPGVHATVDFGSSSDVKLAFKLLRKFQPRGPLVNTEYYPGWIDHWAFPHASVNSTAVAAKLDEILAMNASVTIYLVHGGTHFGFLNGANINWSASKNYAACPTSYDFDAPISESGDINQKYFAIKKVIKKYVKLPEVPVPKPSKKMKIEKLKIKRIGSLFEAIANLSTINSEQPMSFEDLNQAYGYVVYETDVPDQFEDPVLLNVTGIRDRGYVFVDHVFHGILSRGEQAFTIPISVVLGQRLTIIVENQGRICYGDEIMDRKGIISPVYLGERKLRNWTMTSVPLSNSSWLMDTLTSMESSNDVNKRLQILPAFYLARFQLSKNILLPLDTFLRVDGWHKGVAFINGFNVGRYWPIVGPQITLYAPKNLFKPHPGINTLVLLETEHTPCKASKECTVSFVASSELDGPTPSKSNRLYDDKEVQ